MDLFLQLDAVGLLSIPGTKKALKDVARVGIGLNDVAYRDIVLVEASA